MHRAFKIIISVVVLAAVVSTVHYCANPYATETVVYYEYEKAIDGAGYILRDETIVTNTASGVFEPLINDGERISKDTKVGTVISGEPDEKMVEELNSIKQRIEDIEKSATIARLYQSDTMRISSAVKSNIKNLRTAVRDGDLSKATELKKEIGYLKNKTAMLESSDASTELLAQLYRQKEEIETAIGTVQQEIYSPISGVYSSAVDGLEKYGTSSAMSNLLPSDVESFEDILKDYEQSANDVCKITDNFNWYLVAVVSSQEAADVSLGSSVIIEINDATPEEVDGSVYYISEEQDGKNVVIFQCNLYVEGIYGVRNVDYRVVLQRKTGLRIPSEALRIENGKKGVYILIDKKKSFRYVNDNPYRSEDDRYYIVNQKYTPSGAASDYVPLKEYDKVLLNPEEVR